MQVLLVTGGAGFIGSNFIKYFIRRNKNFIVVNIDKLTYAGNINNLRELEDSPRYHFIKGDICNDELVNYVFRKYRPDFIVNFAAESHVDRSIHHPSIFVGSNIMGTLTLLEGAKHVWSKHKFRGNRFLQISTDEVYGSIDSGTDYSREEDVLLPNSPYSASKSGADMMVRAFHQTYGLPAIITRCCNNYGPFQNAEKFIPKCITNALRDEPLPVYGDGKNTREWIHVQDHSIAVIRALFYGTPGEIYNIGTGEEVSNVEMAGKILKNLNKSKDLIKYVDDRPGHDLRYALNSAKARKTLKWSPKYNLEEGLRETIRWYKENRSWWEKK